MHIRAGESWNAIGETTIGASGMPWTHQSGQVSHHSFSTPSRKSSSPPSHNSRSSYSVTDESFTAFSFSVDHEPSRTTNNARNSSSWSTSIITYPSGHGRKCCRHHSVVHSPHRCCEGTSNTFCKTLLPALVRRIGSIVPESSFRGAFGRFGLSWYQLDDRRQLVISDKLL